MKRSVLLLALSLAAPTVVAQRADTLRTEPPRWHVYVANGFGLSTAGLTSVIRAGADGQRWGGALRTTLHGDLIFGSDYTETYALLAARTWRLGRHAHARIDAGPSVVRDVDGPELFSGDDRRTVRTGVGAEAGAALGVSFLHVLHLEAHALAGTNAFRPYVGAVLTGGLRVPIW